MSKIFVLSRSDWEEYTPHILTGPEDMTGKQFRALCDSLLPEAAERAVLIASQVEPCADGTVICDFVGWGEIVDSLTTILTHHGFDVAAVTRCDYTGPCTIRDATDNHQRSGDDSGGALSDATLAIVAAHNAKAEAESDEAIGVRMGHATT